MNDKKRGGGEEALIAPHPPVARRPNRHYPGGKGNSKKMKAFGKARRWTRNSSYRNRTDRSARGT